jgi:hypothetical protein
MRRPTSWGVASSIGIPSHPGIVARNFFMATCPIGTLCYGWTFLAIAFVGYLAIR